MRCGHYKRLVLLVLLISSLFLHCATATAARAPAVYNGKMNTAVGGVITQKVGRWGFAANDPRLGATVNGVGAGLTTVAVGVAGGAVAAVGWPALLAGAGIAALVTAGISLAQDGIYKWLFNSDNTFTTQDGAFPPLLGNMSAWTSFCAGDGVVWGGSQGSVAAGCAVLGERSWKGKPGAPTYAPGGCSEKTCKIYRSAATEPLNFPALTYEIDVSQARSPSQAACPSGVYVQNEGCMTSGLSAPPLNGGTLDQAIENVPQSELSKPVSNALLAAAANAAWRSMAPGTPNAVPWSANDPITPADVAEWKAANPSAVPTVGDAFSPSSSGSPSSGGGVSVSPGATPGTAPQPGPAPTPGQGEKVDLGPNPNTPAPGLEATPTALQILSPLLGLMPDLKKFTVPAHASECPKPSFTALGKVYAIDSHCPLVESNRSIIETAMLLCWTLASVFIVLRA